MTERQAPPEAIVPVNGVKLCVQTFGDPTAPPWPLDAWPDVPTRFVL